MWTAYFISGVSDINKVKNIPVKQLRQCPHYHISFRGLKTNKIKRFIFAAAYIHMESLEIYILLPKSHLKI